MKEPFVDAVYDGPFIDATYNIIEHTAEECIEYESKKRKKVFEYKFADFFWGLAFFVLTLLSTYILHDGIINSGNNYCNFLNKGWNFVFGWFIKSDWSLFLKFSISTLCSVAVSLVIGALAGAISSLFYRDKTQKPEKCEDLAEQYRATLERVKKMTYGGWMVTYMIFHILAFAVSTVIVAIKDPEVQTMNIFVAIFLTAVSVVIVTFLLFIMYSVFNLIFDAVLKIDKLCNFELDLRNYLKMENEIKEMKLVFERKKQAKELYEKAISGEEIDENLMREAAILGDSKAALYMVKKCVFEWDNDTRPIEDKKHILERAKGYLYYCEICGDSETEFLKCLTGFFTDTPTNFGLRNFRSTLDKIAKKGDLPESYKENFKMLDSLVNKALNEFYDLSIPTSQFDAKEYLKQNGLTIYSNSAISQIENDPNLTSSQKEEAKGAIRVWGD